MRIAERTQHWIARFPDVGGLAVEDPVTVHGVKKGAVKEIRLGDNEVLVDFILAKDLPLTVDTEVYVRNVGLMGEKFIAIDLTDAGSFEHGIESRPSMSCTVLRYELVS